MYISITPNIKTLKFKGNNSRPDQVYKPEDAKEEGEILRAIMDNNSILFKINPETKESLFHTVVRKNYEHLVKYVTAKESIASQIINFVSNSKTPLDVATDWKIKGILRARGAKTFTELQSENPSQNNQNNMRDAREVATQVFVSNPIVVRPQDVKPVVTQAQTDKPQQIVNQDASKNVQNINYFDSFEEIDDEPKETNVIVVESSKEQNSKALQAAQEKKFVIEKNGDYEEIVDTPEQNAKPQNDIDKTTKLPESYKNYTVLEIDSKDPDSFDKIIGLDNIKQELNENVVIPINDPQANVTLKANDINIPNGILLNSLANATTLVKALSKEANLPVLKMFNPAELSPMLNDIEKNFKETGNRTIILIQGLDKYFKGASSNPLEEQNFRLKMKNCSQKGALIIATANDSSEVCKDFFESGVIDKVLELKKPTKADRTEYLKKYYNDKHLFKQLNTDENLALLSDLMEGFSYSDINRILGESARTAISNSQETVSIDLIKQEIETFAKEAGITPINEFNKTAMYDTPEFSRIPVVEGEVMSFDELGGMPEVKQRLKNLYVKPMQNIETLKEELGFAAIPDGAIFYGPAGNGKTFTAKTLARELGLPFYETKLSDIGTALVHEEGKAIKKLAKQLTDKYNATGEMSVWFLDEFDSLGSNRAEAHSHNKELTDALLQEFNNPSSRGYILIAATNHIEDVDPALRRRGRLGNWIEFKLPTSEERFDIIQKELTKSKLTKELSQNDEVVNHLVKEFDGNSISNIVNVINDAKRQTILEGKNFREAIHECLDLNTKREMAEFCGKAGLKEHEFSEVAFKTLDELGGLDEVKEKLQENIIDVWNPEIRQALLANRRSLPGGVILEGPPGTGKTTIIETLAREMDVPLFKMNYAQDGNEYIHGVSRNVTDIFNRLALQSKIIKKPVMLFFDEAEKFFPRHANGHQVEEVNTYKELMNTAAASGIILVAATNHIDMVNQEIIGNPRRMGTVVHCGNPDEKNRGSLFAKLLGNLPILEETFSEEQIAALVRISEGYSIGEIADIVDKAITQAVKKKKNLVLDDLLAYFKQKIPHSVRI